MRGQGGQILLSVSRAVREDRPGFWPLDSSSYALSKASSCPLCLQSQLLSSLLPRAKCQEFLMLLTAQELGVLALPYVQKHKKDQSIYSLMMFPNASSNCWVKQPAIFFKRTFRCNYYDGIRPCLPLASLIPPTACEEEEGRTHKENLKRLWPITDILPAWCSFALHIN